MSSTVERRRGRSIHFDLSNQHVDVPAVAAIFLILFDAKAGYSIAWKRSLPGLELNESVEYKSLPSGLHNVHEDLIYFLHDNNYAGISAFINEPAKESERNALMLAIGVLVPLSHGRLGKSWKHAAGLKVLAKGLSKDPTETEPLEEFWASHQIRKDDEFHEAHSPESPAADIANRRRSQHPPKSPARTRKRAVTTASVLAQPLSPHHPALTLPSFLDTFGPLMFPLYRAALLRKRILLVGQAPVELACNYVYDISILSGLPSSVLDLLPLDPLPICLQPLFAVGVHDMQTLAQGCRDQPPDSSPLDDSMGYGWIANTTDDILSHKDRLYDILITMPPSYSKRAKEKSWPKLEVKKGTEIKSTQRDLRRYRILRRELQRFPNSRCPNASRHSGTPDPTANPPFENTQEIYDDASLTLDANLAEPPSWSALAYNSFMWWASAGEKRTDLDEEEEYDAALLRHFNTCTTDDESSPDRPRSARKSPKSPARRRMSTGIMEAMDYTRQPAAGMEMTLIAYFHRLTTLILETLADIINTADYINEDGSSAVGEDTALAKGIADSGDVGEDKDVVIVSSEDMTRMGLDVWSDSDPEFVRELVDFYWGRKAEVRSGRVECCGVRIC